MRKEKGKKERKKAFDIVRLHRGERRWQLRTPQKETTQPTVWWGEKHRTAHQRRYTFRFSYCCLNGLSNVLYIRYINSELNLGYCQRFFMAELFFPLLCCVSLPLVLLPPLHSWRSAAYRNCSTLSTLRPRVIESIGYKCDSADRIGTLTNDISRRPPEK